jgi:hypothetical protein
MGALAIPRSALEGLTAVKTANDSFHEFLARLEARDGDAARELFRRFTGQLVTLARRRLDGPLRHKVDSEDVVQSTYKSFFRRYDQATWSSSTGTACGACSPSSRCGSAPTASPTTGPSAATPRARCPPLPARRAPRCRKRWAASRRRTRRPC